MRFTLEIELGNDAMQTWDDIRNAMRRTDFAIMEETRGVTVSARVGLFPIRDLNGLTVGKWEVTETPSGYLGTHVPFSPSDACWCQPFDGPKHPHCPMHGDDPMGRMYAEAFAPGSEEQQANDRAKAASADLPEGWPNNQPMHGDATPRVLYVRAGERGAEIDNWCVIDGDKAYPFGADEYGRKAAVREATRWELGRFTYLGEGA